jgi:hypothetical protein
MLIIFSFFLSGCKNTLIVRGDFPSPVINQLPFTVGAIFDQSFSQYRYLEKNDKRSEWDVSVGDAQVQLFQQVFTAMFNKVVNNSQITTEVDNSIDLYIQPSIESFQYNVPYETKGNMYEVWLKYNVKVFDEQQQLIADWILTAYGKTPTAFFKSQEAALNEAMVLALRDVGAVLSLKFSHVPEIKSWLKSRKVETNVNEYNQTIISP